MGIEKYKHTDLGFKPIFEHDTWQIAILNYSYQMDYSQIDKVDIHYQTDEIFVLLDGIAVLVYSESPTNGQINIEKMEKDIVYNIPSNLWHNISLVEGSKVLIVEKKGTHLGDFEFHYFSIKEAKKLQMQIQKLMEEE